MPAKKNVPVKFTYPDGKEHIHFVNQFAFSQIDMDIVLDIGVIDPKQILEINGKIQTGTIQPSDHLESIIIQRVGMSISSFVKLKQQLDQIFNTMQKQGILVKKPGQDIVQ